MHAAGLAEMERRNVEFWAAQRKLRTDRMADAFVLKAAIDIQQDEASRSVNVWSRLSFESALERAYAFKQAALADALRQPDAAMKQAVMAEAGRKGGSASKSDRLREIIDAAVVANPRLTFAMLLDILERQASVRNVIQDVEDKKISFEDNLGLIRPVRIEALKSRFHRAKKRAQGR